MANADLSFDTDVGSILIANGWSPIRTSGYSEIELEQLKLLGNTVNPYAATVLASLGNMRFNIFGGAVRWIVFDPLRAIWAPRGSGITNLESQVKESLCVVAEADNYSVLVSVNGSAYLLHDEWLYMSKSISINGMFRFIFLFDESNCEEVTLCEMYA